MRELDKRIAELRGECTHENRVPKWDHVMCVDCRERFYDTEREKWWPITPKPYTTDIRYAFELWQEMKEAGCAPCLYTHGIEYKVEVTVWKTPDRNDYFRIGSETETEAICEVYIAWRENEHCKR